MYFSNCTTPEEIKTLYRELAFKHHPDHGGDTRTMQDINAAYHEALKHANGHNRKDGKKEYTYRYEYEREQAIIDGLSFEVLDAGHFPAMHGMTDAEVESGYPDIALVITGPGGLETSVYMNIYYPEDPVDVDEVVDKVLAEL